MVSRSWKQKFQSNLKILALFMVLAFLAVAAKHAAVLYAESHTLLSGDKAAEKGYEGEYHDYVKRTRTAPIKYVGRRGDIVDRNGVVLATSVKYRSVQAFLQKRYDGSGNPLPYVKNPEAAARALAPLMNKPYGELLKILKAGTNFVYVGRQLPDDICDAIEAEQDRIYKEQLKKGSSVPQEDMYGDLSGIEVVGNDANLRCYPKGRLASQLIGMVRPHDGEGIEGVESAYNKELSPLTERRTFHVDKNGSRIPGSADEENSISASADKNNNLDGKTIVLTIDERIQFITESVLKENVLKFKAKSGGCVILDAATADVLAMAVYPDFLPAEYWKFKDADRRNRIIYDCYEPGSIFKSFTVGVALNSGYSKKSIVSCGDTIVVDGWPIHNSHSSNYHETLKNVIAHSFNTHTATVAMEMGREKCGKGFESFGFGKPTGIDLPGEAEGITAPYQDWQRVNLATISFGQGIGVTLMQLASAAQAVANDGKRMLPHVVKEIIDPRDGSVKKYEPKLLGQPISPEAAAELRDCMTGTVSYGTGTAARLPGYKVAGKTGTAQVCEGGKGYIEGRYNSGFMAIVPADKPKLVVVVRLEEPVMGQHHGGTSAAPVFQEIASKILPLLSIAPQPGYKQLETEAEANN